MVCSATQCHIYSTSNWNTPHIFDLKDPAQLVLQCGRGFALVDAAGAAQVRAVLILATMAPLHKAGNRGRQQLHSYIIWLPHNSSPRLLHHPCLSARLMPGWQVYTYEGRPVCSLKLQGQGSGLEGLNYQLISLSSDTLALASGSSIRCFETAQGRPVGQHISHNIEVKAVCLSQVSSYIAARCAAAVLVFTCTAYVVQAFNTCTCWHLPQQLKPGACM